MPLVFSESDCKITCSLGLAQYLDMRILCGAGVYGISAWAEMRKLSDFDFPPWRKLDFRVFLIFRRGGSAFFVDFWLSPGWGNAVFINFWLSPGWGNAVFAVFCSP